MKRKFMSILTLSCIIFTLSACGKSDNTVMDVRVSSEDMTETENQDQSDSQQELPPEEEKSEEVTSHGLQEFDDPSIDEELDAIRAESDRLWSDYETAKNEGFDSIDLYGVRLSYNGANALNAVSNEEGTTLALYDDQGNSLYVGIWYQDEYPENFDIIVEKQHIQQDQNGVDYYTADNLTTGAKYVAIPESRMYMTIDGDGEWTPLWDSMSLEVVSQK